MFWKEKLYRCGFWTLRCFRICHMETKNFFRNAVECDISNSCLPPPWRSSPKWATAYTLPRLHHHTRTKDSPRWLISPSQRLLLESKQHCHETDIHASCGIRTRNPSKRATADPHRRPPGHWDCLRFRSVLKILCLLVENRKTMEKVTRRLLDASKEERVELKILVSPVIQGSAVREWQLSTDSVSNL